MGGIWGVGASLAFESIPTRARGFVSGLMQAGYSTGYLFASLAFGFFYALIGWRGLFMIGALPALLLIVYIQTSVTESPGWKRFAHPRRHHPDGAARSLAAGAVWHHPDDRLHLLQPWHPGYLSRVPAEAARLCACHRLRHRGGLQYRRDSGRASCSAASVSASAAAAPSSPPPCWRCRSPRSGLSPPPR